MFDQATIEMLLEGVVDTLYMTLVSTFFSYVFGMMMGTVLVICRQDGITPRPMIYAVLDVVVNLTRSFPFLNDHRQQRHGRPAGHRRRALRGPACGILPARSGRRRH